VAPPAGRKLVREVAARTGSVRRGTAGAPAAADRVLDEVVKVAANGHFERAPFVATSGNPVVWDSKGNLFELTPLARAAKA
jgi:hypothetical protein